METIRFLENTKNADWEYDEEADTHYMSIGTPREAMGVDVGNGVIVRYDENTKSVIGVTLVGIRERFVQEMKMAG
jgi:uncharacterized protein YuzE